jgi:hypothetical protein
MNEKDIGRCKQVVWEQDGAVCIVNDDDGFYVTEFNTHKEVEALISELKAAAEKAFTDELPSTDVFSKEIEEELNSLDFDELIQTRLQMGKLLTEQKVCKHDFYITLKGDIPSAQRCRKCGYQEFL